MPLIATFLCSVLLFSTAFARPSTRDRCGPNAQVISEKSAPYGNKEIKFVTRFCPGFATLRNTTTQPAVRKRQVSLCPSACTSLICVPSIAQPPLEDCVNLAEGLIELNETFAVSPETATEASFGQCFFEVSNLDTATLNLCSSGFGLLGFDLADSCSTAGDGTAGDCVSPQVPGDNFVIETGAA
ncbi:hypothetical protein M422DRAFT_31050 [Sphaerobolus stellatus SS14]|uniref:Uncharacterized protein n=1 Tax=Sphaerobolus stellatus (strain SS14) TaxID=990650 RepID=A0A0C9VWH5_SPHS4|nr:hypothetical protein M422DRAFT_31050 [Sphaerobolus stellatus SS14]